MFLRFLTVLMMAASWPVFGAKLPNCELAVHLVSGDGFIAQQASLGPEHVAKIESKGKDRVTGYELWQVTLTQEGASLNRGLTEKSIGKYLAIYCDGQLLVKPRVMGPSEGVFLFSVAANGPNQQPKPTP